MSQVRNEQAYPYLNVLHEKQQKRIHDATLQVLARVGVTVQDITMRNRLREVGCRMDEAMQRVYMDESVVNAAIAASPSTFDGKARNSGADITLASGRTTLFINACGTRLFDIDTGTCKDASRKEFYDYIRVMDALPNVAFQNCFPLFGFENVPECMRLIESVAAKYRMSEKVQIEGTVFDNYVFTTQMAQAMECDLFQIVNSAAPLTYYQETAEQMRCYASAGLPVHFAAGPTRGLTCPMTSAGAVISNNAETLAGIVMAQAVRPGTRVWVNSMIMTPDMRTGNPAFGDVGNSLTDAAFNQMWRQYGIPCWSNAPAWTSAKAIDYQAAFEMCTAAQLQALTGATVISFQGGMYAERYVHPAKAIIDDDIAGMILRLQRGLRTDDDALALDLIEEVGPIPGSFMDSDLTLEHWREECYLPTVSSRSSHSDWLKNGRKGILDAAIDRWHAILETHSVAPLSPSKESALEDILRDARQYYRKKGLISDHEWNLYQKDLASLQYPYA